MTKEITVLKEYFERYGISISLLDIKEAKDDADRIWKNSDKYSEGFLTYLNEKCGVFKIDNFENFSLKFGLSEEWRQLPMDFSREIYLYQGFKEGDFGISLFNNTISKYRLARCVVKNPSFFEKLLSGDEKENYRLQTIFVKEEKEKELPLYNSVIVEIEKMKKSVNESRETDFFWQGLKERIEKLKVGGKAE